eukprot:gene6847-7065_t
MCLDSDVESGANDSHDEYQDDEASAERNFLRLGGMTAGRDPHVQSLLRCGISHSLPVFERLADEVYRLDAQVLDGRARIKMTRHLHVLFIGLSILARR